MLINEIFTSKADITWTTTSRGFNGSFSLDDKNFDIIIDEYEAELDKRYSLVDFGFTANGTWDITNDHKNSGKILGIVFNAMIMKLKELQPDWVMFGVNFKNGQPTSRKSLYERMAILYSKGSVYSHMSDWIKTPNGEYKILSKQVISDDAKVKINEIVASVQRK